MTFQLSLLAGFLNAAGKIVNATDGELWLTARGVPCFDFATPVPSRFADLAQGVPGVLRTGRVDTGFTVWKKPSGDGLIVVLIGSEPQIAGRLPQAVFTQTSASVPNGIVIDRSNAGQLGITGLPVDVEVGIESRRASVVFLADGFGTFLGSPYVFTSHALARKYLEMPIESSSFIVVKLEPSADRFRVADLLRRRLFEIDVWQKEDFARASGIYWMAQTGAGGALITAAILGLLVGTVVVSQNIYGSVLDRLEEFATLKAIGATRWFVVRLVVYQALAAGAVGATVGLAIVFPAISAARRFISWATTPLLLPPIVFAIAMGMCVAASIAAARRAITVDPGMVFRA
jgi:putative ABC transport system permease protein